MIENAIAYMTNFIDGVFESEDTAPILSVLCLMVAIMLWIVLLIPRLFMTDSFIKSYPAFCRLMCRLGYIKDCKDE